MIYKLVNTIELEDITIGSQVIPKNNGSLTIYDSNAGEIYLRDRFYDLDANLDTVKSYLVDEDLVLYKDDVAISTVNEALKEWRTIKNLYKTFLQTKETGPRDISHKLRVHVTPRKIGLTTYYTSVGDDVSDISVGGNGSIDTNRLFIHHEVGDATTQSVYLDLNIAENETWIYEGYLQCKGALGDMVTLELVSIPTAYSSGTDTNYNIVSGLIIPAAGDGTITLDNDMTDPRDGLIYIPSNDDGSRPSLPCYWDADYNATTHAFENIAPNYTGDGYYVMFAAEVSIARFVHKFTMVGDQGFRLDSYDTDRLGQGMRVKMTAHTVGADHEWWLTGGLTLFRNSIS